ncbi:MAG: methyltransferase domain-containing protein [Chitinivibrionales bacterium]|nr:methyltransferase domain-containing protein [Chitinivibrionales bacterium]
MFTSTGESIALKDNSFDLVIMCEVIEHVENPDRVLREIRRILHPDGKLIISFPNYLNALYLAILVFGEVLNKPNWLDRQVVDRSVFYPFMLQKLKKHGFSKLDVIGKTYGHLKIPGFRWIEKLENPLNACKLHFLSFHPVILLQKC